MAWGRSARLHLEKVRGCDGAAVRECGCDGVRVRWFESGFDVHHSPTVARSHRRTIERTIVLSHFAPSHPHRRTLAPQWDAPDVLPRYAPTP